MMGPMFIREDNAWGLSDNAEAHPKPIPRASELARSTSHEAEASVQHGQCVCLGNKASEICLEERCDLWPSRCQGAGIDRRLRGIL